MSREANSDSPNDALLSMRHLKGMTQEKVAKEIGISRNYYSQIENRKRIPGKELSLKIADYWGIDVRRVIE